MPDALEPLFEIDDADGMIELVGPGGPALKKIASGFRAADGPVWSDTEGGFLLFCDLLNNKRFRWARKSGITPVRGDAKQAAAHAYDAQGRLITCEMGARRLSRTEKDGSLTPLVERHSGKKLNGPVAVAVHSDGSLWFADSGNVIKKDPIDQPGRYIYRLDLKGHHLSVVATDIDQPGALCFSPDESRLYVSDNGPQKHIRVYPVIDGKTLGGSEMFYTPGANPRGLARDAAGRLYVACDNGLHIVTTSGRRIGRCTLPAAPSSNPIEGGKLTPDPASDCCVGETGGTTLFLTSRASLYAMTIIT